MKAKFYITTLLVTLLALTSMTAGAQVLRDPDFNATGRINANGVVRDNDFHSLGTFEADGRVLKADGTEVARIKRLEIYNPAGERLGYINSDGTVRDGNSTVLGAVNLNDGRVSDAAHNTLGFARGIRVDWIACYYFFHLFE